MQNGGILSFQRLAGETTTDGKILDELIKLNSKSAEPDVIAFFKALYPNNMPKLIQKVFVSTTDGAQYWGDGDPVKSFGSDYFGIWTISVFSGGDNEDRDDIVFRNSLGENVYLASGSQIPHTFIGQISSAERTSGWVNFSASFIGFEIVASASYIVGENWTPDLLLSLKLGDYELNNLTTSNVVQYLPLSGTNNLEVSARNYFQLKFTLGDGSFSYVKPQFSPDTNLWSVSTLLENGSFFEFLYLITPQYQITNHLSVSLNVEHSPSYGSYLVDVPTWESVNFYMYGADSFVFTAPVMFYYYHGASSTRFEASGDVGSGFFVYVPMDIELGPTFGVVESV